MSEIDFKVGEMAFLNCGCGYERCGFKNQIVTIKNITNEYYTVDFKTGGSKDISREKDTTSGYNDDNLITIEKLSEDMKVNLL